jgi:uncharacterized protein YjiS (DUF1127 family)
MMAYRRSIRVPERSLRDARSVEANISSMFPFIPGWIGTVFWHARGPARAGRWLIDCYLRSRDRRELAQLDHHMRADLGHDRVEAELAKRPWQP